MEDVKGFQYKFDFENNKNDDDILIQEEKIYVLIDERVNGINSKFKN